MNVIDSFRLDGRTAIVTGGAGRYGKQISTRSILFNVGDQTASNERKRMWAFGDIHSFIRQQGYDPEFWHNNEIVRRTPVEEQVMELFEHQNLFGVFQ